LRGVGATVFLTRNDEAQLPAVEKVRLAGQVGADLFLTIGRHASGLRRNINHHPGSPIGKSWAEAARRASLLLPTPLGASADTCVIAPSSAYLLRHTSCPALSWTFDPPQTSTTELLQLHPGWQRAEARTILLAIAAISGQPDIMSQLIDLPQVLIMLADQGGLEADAVEWVMLDGNLMWSPLPVAEGFTSTDESVASGTGQSLPARLDQHVLEVHTADQWQLWLLTRIRQPYNDQSWRPIKMLTSNDRLDQRADR